jgi:hypothetical protein
VSRDTGTKAQALFLKVQSMGSGQHMPFIKSVVANAKSSRNAGTCRQSQAKRAIVQYNPCLEVPVKADNGNLYPYPALKEG